MNEKKIDVYDLKFELSMLESNLNFYLKYGQSYDQEIYHKKIQKTTTDIEWLKMVLKHRGVKI